jgi:hypothetical protein
MRFVIPTHILTIILAACSHGDEVVIEVFLPEELQSVFLPLLFTPRP